MSITLDRFCVVDSSVVSCSQVSVSVCCFVDSLCVPLSVVRVVFTEIIFLCSENHKKHINTLCGYISEILIIKLVVLMVTSVM
jgi:hypothetical protein